MFKKTFNKSTKTQSRIKKETEKNYTTLTLH